MGLYGRQWDILDLFICSLYVLII